MRAWRATLMASMLAAALLAGCTVSDEPEESTEPLDEPPVVTPTPIFTPSPTPEVTPEPTEPTPVEPTPTEPVFEPVPPGVGVVFHPDPQPVEPAPAEPAPEPEPAAEPEQEPAPDPQPAPEPEPSDEQPPADEDEPDDEPAWPREGSYVRVTGFSSESYPSTFSNQSEWVAEWTYRDGDWRGRCEGTYEHDWDGGTSQDDTSGTFSRTFRASDPPHWPLFNTRNVPDVGDEVEVWLLWDCDIRSEDMIYSGLVNGFHTADDTQEAEENYSDFDTRWDPETGLVVEFSWLRSHSTTRGTVETDAPGL